LITALAVAVTERSSVTEIRYVISPFRLLPSLTIPAVSCCVPEAVSAYPADKWANVSLIVEE